MINGIRHPSSALGCNGIVSWSHFYDFIGLSQSAPKNRESIVHIAPFLWLSVGGRKVDIAQRAIHPRARPCSKEAVTEFAPAGFESLLFIRLQVGRATGQRNR